MADVVAVHSNNSTDLAVAVADAVAQATTTTNNNNNHSNTPRPCPTPLPPGWVLKASQSNPGYFYYFSIPTGETSWTPPAATVSVDTSTTATSNQENHSSSSSMPEEDDPDRSSKRRKPARDDSSGTTTTTAAATAAAAASASSTATDSPKQVRVLHILKKHTGSRRPSSWRQAKITASIDQAKEELEGLLQVIQEEENPEDRQATFSELARTESDCTSAKRGGDLGFFGRRKMQPAFEDASFALGLQQLSGIVETSSGVHLILRIG
eukprot:Nitzschia sp. Nitz4//scaffold148_size54725//34701//35701//NITZ4_006661-RA/size54725-processed-gene-0.15-mRNA-1//1//CDS//3329536757//4422//frame0